MEPTNTTEKERSIMKHLTLYRSTIATVVLVFSTLTTSAQSIESFLILKIPFDFQIKEDRFPAGKYTFKRIPNMPGVLVMQGFDKRTVMVFAKYGVLDELPTRFTVTFHEYGAQRYLSEVMTAHRGYHFSLSKTKVELELAQTKPLRIIRVIPPDKSLQTPPQANKQTKTTIQ
jgi:hypothetical protein